MQTPITPSNDLIGLDDCCDKNEDDDFYSAPPSRKLIDMKNFFLNYESKHLATHITEEPSNTLNDQNSSEQARIYDQATFLNSLIRNMVNEQQNRQDKSTFHRKEEDIQRSSSNDSCFTNTIQVNKQISNIHLTFDQYFQSNQPDLESGDSYTEMYNLIRLLSPGVKC